MLFGDVKMEKKWAHSVSLADKISLYFPSIKIFPFFGQKEDDLLPLFHKMFKGLQMSFKRSHRTFVGTGPVFCPGFQKGRVPSEKGTLAR